MSQIQNYLNEFTLKGYSTEYENFFAALNQLDLTPADTSAKNQLINNAKSMTDYFNTLATNLRNVQIDANNEIKILLTRLILWHRAFLLLISRLTRFRLIMAMPTTLRMREML